MSPSDWLNTQIALANAMNLLAATKGDDPAALRDAIAEHRKALAALDPEADPSKWATMQQSMALSLDALAEQTGDVADLDAAIAAATAARDVRARAGLENSEAFVGWLAGMQQRRAARP